MEPSALGQWAGLEGASEPWLQCPPWNSEPPRHLSPVGSARIALFQGIGILGAMASQRGRGEGPPLGFPSCFSPREKAPHCTDQDIRKMTKKGTDTASWRVRQSRRVKARPPTAIWPMRRWTPGSPW